MDSRLSHTNYTLRRKFFKFFGKAFHIYAGNELVFYAKLKAFKLKEDIRLYTSEDLQEEVLFIKARQILDFSAAYDVVDSKTGRKVGALKRKGFKSLFRDSWIIMDANDIEIGKVEEDSMKLALVRRYITSLIPQNFRVLMGDRPVAELKQHFNPFIYRLDLHFMDASLDRHLGLALLVLISSIEGRQR